MVEAERPVGRERLAVPRDAHRPPHLGIGRPGLLLVAALALALPALQAVRIDPADSMRAE
jgi:hypothetical protein